jgi:hypothetical protein
VFALLRELALKIRDGGEAQSRRGLIVALALSNFKVMLGALKTLLKLLEIIKPVPFCSWRKKRC